MTEEDQPGRVEPTEDRPPSRVLRRGAALLVLAVVGGVSVLAWEEPEEASAEAPGNGATWAIWPGAAILACLAAAVLFRKDRELRTGVLPGPGPRRAGRDRRPLGGRRALLLAARRPRRASPVHRDY